MRVTQWHRKQKRETLKTHLNKLDWIKDLKQFIHFIFVCQNQLKCVFLFFSLILSSFHLFFAFSFFKNSAHVSKYFTVLYSVVQDSWDNCFFYSAGKQTKFMRSICKYNEQNISFEPNKSSDKIVYIVWLCRYSSIPTQARTKNRWISRDSLIMEPKGSKENFVFSFVFPFLFLSLFPFLVFHVPLRLHLKFGVHALNAISRIIKYNFS